LAPAPNALPSPILVTGGSGFAGSHVVDRLAGRAAIYAWHRPGRSIEESRTGITWQGVDLLDRDAVTHTIDAIRPAAIYHVAGASRVDTSWSNVVPHLETNVLGTHHLLEAVRTLGLRCRVLVVTSGMVYQIGNEPVSEDAPLVPASPYGLSKVAQDQLALRACDDGLDVVVARPFNHAGPRQAVSFSVPSFARQIALIERGQADPVIHVGNLDTRRDLTDVRDVAAAYERLVEAGASGRAYNVCSGRAVRIGDLLDELLRLSTVSVRIEPAPDRMRPSDTPVVAGDPSRIRTELGWTPRFALADTLEATLEWWRHQVS
jgi:GDP-4-dehydro-6-deoxy-D-mannose reductase